MKSLKVFTILLATLSMTFWTPAALAGPRNVDDLVPGGRVRPDLPPTRRVTTEITEGRSPMMRVRGAGEYVVGPHRAVFTDVRPSVRGGVRIQGEASSPEVLTEFDFEIPRHSRIPTAPGQSVDDYMEMAPYEAMDHYQVKISGMDGNKVRIHQQNDILREHGYEVTRHGEFEMDIGAANGGDASTAMVRTQQSFKRALPRENNQGPEFYQQMIGKRSADGRSLEIDYYFQTAVEGSNPSGVIRTRMPAIEMPENVGDIVDYDIDLLADSELTEIFPTPTPNETVMRINVATADGRNLEFIRRWYETPPSRANSTGEITHRDTYPPQTLGYWNRDGNSPFRLRFNDPVRVRQAETGVTGDGNVTGMGDLFGGSDATN